MKLSKIPKNLRIPLGLLTAAAGVIPPTVFYYTTNSPTPKLGSILAIVTPCVGLCLLAFIASRFIFKQSVQQSIAGLAGSGLLLIAALFVGGALHGSLQDLIAWLPVILIVGTFAMSPLLGMTWLGTTIMFAEEKTNPDKPMQEKPVGSPDG